MSLTTLKKKTAVVGLLRPAAPKESVVEGRVTRQALRHFSVLGRRADNGETIDVTDKSDDEILALIRR